jgi:hypothetical protein
MRGMAPQAAEDQRPALLSAVFLVAYVGLGVSAVIPGALISSGAALTAVASGPAVALAGADRARAVHRYAPGPCTKPQDRVNRRHSRRRSMLFDRLLELAVVAEPISYHSLIVRPKPTGRRPSIVCRPGRVAIDQAAERPWRQNEHECRAP